MRPWFPAGPRWFSSYCQVTVRINAYNCAGIWPVSSKVAFPVLPDYNAICIALNKYPEDEWDECNP